LEVRLKRLETVENAPAGQQEEEAKVMEVVTQEETDKDTKNRLRKRGCPGSSHHAKYAETDSEVRGVVHGASSNNHFVEIKDNENLRRVEVLVKKLKLDQVHYGEELLLDEIMLEELVGDKVVKVCDNHKTLDDDDDEEEDDLEKKANIDSMDAPAFSRMLEFLNIEDVKNLRLTNNLLMDLVETMDKRIPVLSTASLQDMQDMLDLVYLKAINLGPLKFLEEKDLGRLLRKCGHLLRSLTVVSSDITGESLGQAEQTSKLETLVLEWCRQLTDSGLLNLLRLSQKSLKKLSLKSAAISGEGLSELTGRLSKLEYLDLGGCEQVQDTGLVHLLNLSGPNLKILGLESTGVTGEGLSALAEPLAKLESLDLDVCEQLTDTGLLNLVRLSSQSLKRLCLASTGITGESLSNFNGRLDKLQSLCLKYCQQLTDEGLLNMLELSQKSLARLCLKYTKISGEGLDSFSAGRLENIQCLNLNVCEQLSDDGLVNLIKISHQTLKELSLVRTSITGEGLSAAHFDGQMDRLEMLDLTGCREFTNNGLVNVLRLSHGSLRNLSLSNTRVTGAGLDTFPEELKQLEYLGLGGCKWLKDTGLRSLLSLCKPSLIEVCLKGTNISGKGLSAFAGRLEQLDSVCLSGCKQFKDRGLLNLLNISKHSVRKLCLNSTSISGRGLSNFKGLLENVESMDLSGCKLLRDGGLVNLLRISMHNLRNLCLESTRISGKGLAALTGHFEKLESLDLSGCKQLTDVGLLNILRISRFSLKKVWLQSTHISGEALTEYTGKMEKLETLGLGGCKKVKYTGLSNLLRVAGKQLKELQLSWTEVQGHELADLIELRNKDVPLELNKIVLVGCSNVSAEDVSAITAVLPNCDIKY